jgi:hypothetical protein
MSFLIILIVLFVVVLFVTAPLRRARRVEPGWSTQLAELEAAREAKYREIRDAELDHRTGKLSDADYQALDVALRAEAIELMRRIDRLGESLGSNGGAGALAEEPARIPAP